MFFKKKVTCYVIYIMAGIINITCLNGNGLRDLNKVIKVIDMFKADVICLQETHWSEGLMGNIKGKWKDLIYVNHGNERDCGVAILLKSEKFKQVKQVFNDGKGRLLAIDFLFFNEIFRLINIYAHNVEIERKDLFKKLKEISNERSIVIGDFNVWRTRMDASNSAKFRSDASRKVLNEWMYGEKKILLKKNSLGDR